MYGVACCVPPPPSRNGLCEANGACAMSLTRARNVGVSEVTRNA